MTPELDLGQQTPIPWKKAFPVYFLTFAENLNGYAIFSYVGFLVQDIVPEAQTDHTLIGYYGGQLGCIYYAASFLSCFLWGKLSDKYGRKPILVFGSASGMLCTLLFALTLDFRFAMFVRFLAGLLNANLGATKTYLGEISDTSNQIALFTLWTVAEGLAGIAGAIIGGYLLQYPDAFSADGFFARYPYFLVNLITAVLYGISAVWCSLFMPESLENPHPICGTREVVGENKGDDEVTEAKYYRVDLNNQDNTAHHNSKSSSSSSGEEGEEEKMVMIDFESIKIGDDAGAGVNEKLFRLFSGLKQELIEEFDPPARKWSLWRDKPALLTCFLYAAIGFAFIIFWEVLPLWTIAHVSDGGLDFEPTDVGRLGGFGSFCLLFLPFLTKWIISKLGLINTMRLGLVITVILPLCFPPLNYIVNSVNKIFFWALIFTLYMTRFIASQLSYTPVIQLIQNSVLPENAGSTNGFGQSLASLCRAVAPFIGGSVLSWGISGHRPFPFNSYFSFLMISVTAIMTIGLTCWLPQSLNIPLKSIIFLNKESEETEDASEELDGESETAPRTAKKEDVIKHNSSELESFSDNHEEFAGN